MPPPQLNHNTAEKWWLVHGPDSGGVRGWLLWKGNLFPFEHEGHTGHVGPGLPIEEFIRRYTSSENSRIRKIILDISRMQEQRMFVVMTTVPVLPGQIDAVRQLFAATNPELVAKQKEWVEALFTANYETNEITVLAFWRDADAYRQFSASAPFREVMAQFRPHFAGPPRINISEVLLLMERKGDEIKTS